MNLHVACPSMQLKPVAPERLECKCCGAPALRFGVVDFNKNCEILRRQVLDVAGVPVYYHRCTRCGFLFTAAFDHWSHDDFARDIYNDEYLLVDPDFPEVRPRSNAQLVAEMFAASPSLRILDYGGGNGLLARELRARDFSNVDTYDPFVPEHAARPAGRYDCVVSFEVVEHVPDPVALFRDMDSLVEPGGAILFSTLLQPEDLEQYGLGWWYAAPRNGHVSLHTQRSLLSIVDPMGLTFGSFHPGLHILFRVVPAFAAHLLRAT